MNTPNPTQPNPLAKHPDPSLRRDRSLRRPNTRPRRTAAASVEWVTPNELAMRAAAGVIAAGRDASIRAVTATRRRAASTARGGGERARKLAPVSAFGAARRRRDGRGLSL